jgi:hypothetical protein
VTRSLYEPTPERATANIRFIGKDTRQQPFAGDWIYPLNDAECPPIEGDPNPWGGIQHDWTPCLLNDWLQVDPADAGLESFAFRTHYDGSLEFKGHLDASGGATSGSAAFILPGMNTLEPDYIGLLDNSQFWDTVITDDVGSSFQMALVLIDTDTGEVIITWPVS